MPIRQIPVSDPPAQLSRATGLMTPEQKEMALTWLMKHWKGEKQCPICGSNDWILGDHIVFPPLFSGSGLSVGGPAYPQFMVISVPCGHTLYFNALVSGIMAIAPSQKEGSK
jgi:hypothetical protein